MSRAAPKYRHSIALAACTLWGTLCGAYVQARNPATPLDTLAGEIHGTVSGTGRPYLVTTDLIVPVGETVTIASGTTLLFSEFTGIQVHGTLLAHGTDEQPVVFTSQNDQRYSQDTSVQAAPYDWNGIVVHEDAVGTTLRHCSIEYSLFGLKSLTSYLTVDECAFSRNAKGNFSVAGMEQSTQSGLYSYSLAPKLTIDTVAPMSRPVVFLGHTVRAPVLAGFSAGLTLVGAGLAGWRAMSYRESLGRFNALSQITDENRTNVSIAKEYDNAARRTNTDLALLIAGSALTVVGLVGLTFTF